MASVVTFASPARLLTLLNAIILPSKESCLPLSSPSTGSTTTSLADASYSTLTTDLLCSFSTQMTSIFSTSLAFTISWKTAFHSYTPFYPQQCSAEVPQNAKTLAPKP
ncbi:hypothetical protein QOT17_014897 [Balamuthia mandrillaris]